MDNLKINSIYQDSGQLPRLVVASLAAQAMNGGESLPPEIREVFKHCINTSKTTQSKSAGASPTPQDIKP